jgi:nicotinate-nucleotide--dimethylbenzimidazole phosphoribosyltransferase
MPEGIPRYLGCFAEPMGCVLNAFEKMGLNPGDRLLVYGGGTLGMLFAMVSSKRKIRPVVIEQDERKAARCRAFLEAIGTISCPTTAECNFDGAVNACGASEAFGMAILKTRKSGTVCFFSGLAKETSTDAGILNLAHYRELRIAGTYGLTRRHLKEALELIPSCARHLELLVEDVISLADVPHIMPEVLSGKRFKYIIDMQTPDPTGSIGHFPGSR